MQIAESDGRKVRAAERREESRERILAAAVDVFAEQGFHAGTTKAITQRAGVADGLLFHYFPTKSDLMVAVLAENPLGAEIRRDLEGAADEPTAELLPRAASRWLAALRGHRPVALVLLQEAHSDPQVRQAVATLTHETVDVLAHYFAARIAAGELRPFDTEVAAQMLLQSLCSLIIPCADIPAGDEERVLAAQIDLLLHGMLA